MPDATPRYNIPCVIFAGGKSSRMGSDKSLLPFGGYNSLAEYQYRRLSKLFTKVYISTKENKFDFKADLIKDNMQEDTFAPTAGFEAIFSTLRESSIFVLSVDTPFVGVKEIEKLISSDKTNLDAVIAKTASGIHPMCGLYHRSLQPEFTQMLQTNNHRLGMLLQKSHTKFVAFEDDDAFANLNHPHEFQEALSKSLL